MRGLRWIAVLTLCLVPAVLQATTNDAAWRADIDFLVQELPRRHKNAFFHTSREAFEQAAASLKNDLPSLADHQAVVRLLKLVASIGDSHTSVSGYAFSRYPIVLYWFSDGLFVVRATAAHEDLIGTRVVSIGGTPIGDVQTLIGETIAYENDSWLLELSPDRIVRPEVLHTLGVIPSPGSARFVFHDASGAEIERDLIPLPAGGSTPFVERPAAESGPLYRRNAAFFYWYEYLPREQILYLKYNVCAQAQGKSFSAFLAEIGTFSESHPVVRIVLDMRNNHGGNSAVLQPFISAIQTQPDVNRGDRFFVIIGRGTFSSAMLNSIDLDRQTNATFVGEPTGGKPNSYGEVLSFMLPRTFLTIHYSTKFFEVLPGQDPPAFVPDQMVLVSSSDYFAGRDPVLASVVPPVVKRRAVRR